MKKITLAFLLFALPFSSALAQDTLRMSRAKSFPKLPKSSEALGISPEVEQRNSLLVNAPMNIALFGTDSRNSQVKGNADVIIILSINPSTQKLKMSSILRDTYVDIEGIGMDKINAAYAQGGPLLAVKTINRNFALDIKDYIHVDFLSAAAIVNALGGVNINLKPEELTYLNNYVKEISFDGDIPVAPVSKAGLQNLNGRQAVAYTRIRDAGRGDYDRTDRQKAVLVALFSKMQGGGVNLLPVFLSKILPNLETSMNQFMLLSMGSHILNSKTKVIEQGRFPLDSASKGERINNIWYLKTDLKATSNSLYNFIYKDVKAGN
ncbi:LCP family protein [Daejeonella sp.]|uniref:LCP family protein n=1 Tax=Daejeonella sp. TaxID=2805397 RepID=UPI0039832EA3